MGVTLRPYVRQTMRWLIDGRRGHMPIPPEDYARHSALEAALPPDGWIDESPLFDQCKPRSNGWEDRYSSWSQWDSASHLVPPQADYARHWELEGPHA